MEKKKLKLSMNLIFKWMISVEIIFLWISNFRTKGECNMDLINGREYLTFCDGKESCGNNFNFWNQVKI